MNNRIVCMLAVLSFLMMTVTVCVAQKQLVVLKGENVKLRLYPGDEIVIKLKNSKKKRESYVNNLLDYAVVLHHDTVPLNQIDRIYFRQPSLLNKIGGLLFFGGAAFLVIDQVNNSLVQGNEFSVESDFTKTTLIAMGVGLPLFLVKKKSSKVGNKNRLMVVTKGSAFYRPDMRRNLSTFDN